MSGPLLDVRGLVRMYRAVGGQEVTAVNGISFHIGQSESVGLVGASGSGKSSTARCVLQLDRPDHGAVVFKGIDLCGQRGRRLERIRLGIQMVFQDPLSSLDPRWPIHRTVEEPLYGAGMKGNQARGKALDALRLVGLKDEIQRRPHELSGGQAQRAAIARAVVASPQLLICDEATSALDVSIQAQILNLLKDLQASLGLALLFISHDLGVIRAMCERIYVIASGHIVEHGPTREILESPGSEYTKLLVEAAARHW